MPAVVPLPGLVAAAIGGRRSYAVAREALAPLVHEGGPTRTAVEASRPLPMRARVRQLLRWVVVSLGWMGAAMCGLHLVAYGQGMSS